MLAQIYLLQLELAAQASQKPQPKPEPAFVPFSIESYVSKRACRTEQSPG